ncbi:MAG TPA: hypothetical protein VF137_10855 [Candidatus Dormibacteraeota bacterium]
MKRGLKRRYRVLLIGIPVALLPLFVLPFVAFAQIPDSVERYGAGAKAAGLRVFGYDNSLQFLTVDSSFPLAFSTQSGGGGLGYADATASYYDYGPAGVTLLGVPDGQGVNVGLGPQSIPPAHAYYPGKTRSTIYPTQSTFGASEAPPGQGPYATGSVDETSSHAQASYVGNVQGTLPVMTTNTSSVLSPDGSVTTTAESYVASATIGPFVFDKIHVIASVATSNGTGRVETSSVQIGSVQANGNTVALTDQGLTIGPQQTTQPISINGTQAAGFVTYTAELVAPEKSIEGSKASLTAMGVKVTAVESLPTGDIINEEYDLGYASVDADLTPSTGSSLAGLNFSVPSGFGSLSGTGTLSAGAFPQAIQPNPATAARPIHNVAPLVLLRSSRKPLALAFLGWEALVMCGVAAWVWARKTVMAA